MDKVKEFIQKYILTEKIKGITQKLQNIFTTPSRNRTLVLLGIFALIVALPVTVIFLQQRTQTQQNARIVCDTYDYWQCGSPSSCSNGHFGTDQWVHVYDNSSCITTCFSSGRVLGKCGVCAGAGTQCGVNSDCCGGGNTTYCSRQGKCTAYCNPVKEDLCNGSYLCTGSTFNANKVCAAIQYSNTCSQVPGKCGVPQTCGNLGGSCIKNACGNGSTQLNGTCPSGDWTCCKNACTTSDKTACCPSSSGISTTHMCQIHTDIACEVSYTDQGWNSSCDTSSCTARGGTCRKYQCNDNESDIGGTCSFSDSACCKVQTPIYTCIQGTGTGGTSFSGSNQQIGYCPSGKSCLPKATYPTNNGVSDAANHLCIYSTTQNSCELAGNSCEKYQCGNNEKSVGGSCGVMADSVCCQKTTTAPTYTCLDGNFAFVGSNGSVIYCDTGNACNKSKYNTSSGFQPSYTSPHQDADAKAALCTTEPSCSQINATCTGAGNSPQTQTGYYQNETYANTFCTTSPIAGTCSTANTTCCPNSSVISAIDTGVICIGPDGKTQGTCWYNALANVTSGQYYDASDPVVPPNGKVVLYTSTKGGKGICGTTPSLPYLMPQGYPTACLGNGTPSSGNPKNCTVVGGYCGKFGDACKGYYDENYGALSCGTGTVCCVPQPSCSDVHGYCSSYAKDDGACTSGHVQNSTFPGCGSSGICCIPLAPVGPTNCGSIGGKCIAVGNACPSNYEVNDLGDSSCTTGTFCCIPKPGTTPPPTQPPCDPTVENCNPSGGPGNPTATPAPSCQPGQSTQLAINLSLDGISASGVDNNAPAHTTRTAIYVNITDESNTNVTVPNSTSIVFTYGHGTFNSPTIDLGTSLSCGHTYTVSVKIPRYLPVKGTVAYGKSNVIALSPITGDINKVRLSDKVIVGDDQVTINDYAIVRACHNVDPNTPQTFTDNTSTVTVTCGELMNFIDYADGGTQGDEWSFNYNAWARGYVKANGY